MNMMQQADNGARMEKCRKRQAELSKLSDEELKDRFHSLCSEVVTPIAELARTHTSPSIERSVLLRMGIDSVSTHAIVKRIHEAGLLGKGAGNIVLRVSKLSNCSIRDAGQAVIDDREILNVLKSKISETAGADE